MFKKILKLFTVSFVFVFLLVSCDKEIVQTPKHESDSIWHMDETSHWFGCVIEGCTSVFEKSEHIWGEWIVSKEASCTSFGEEYKKCSICGYEQRRNVAKLEHKYDTTFKYDEYGHWHECSICHVIQTDSKKEHNYLNFKSNNDAKCDANGTETGTCKDCGYVHTKETPNSKLEHKINKDTYKYNDTYHWYPCSTCNEIVEPVEHTLTNLEVVKKPTFDEEGISQGICSVCNQIGKVSIPKLIPASEVFVLSDDINIDINETYDLEILVGPEDAENYVIECESNNDEIVSIDKVDGNHFTIKGVKNGKSIITIRVLNVIDKQTYSIVEKEIICMVNSTPVVKYTFDQNVENSGSDQNVNGRVTTMSGDKIVDIDSSVNVEYVDAENGTPNGAIKLSQKKEGGNHFTITGLNIGINDFTIKTKLFIDSVIPENQTEAAYILGIGSETDPLGNVKDVKAPYFNLTYKRAPEYFKGSNQLRVVANSAKGAYMVGTDGQHWVIPHQEWIEITIIKEGNNLYFSLSNEKLREVGITHLIVLDDKANIDITKECNLGFTANSGCKNPSSASVLIDSIEIYDYAINHSFSSFIHSDASCTKDEYESAKCDYCDYVFIKEIPGTKLQHEIIDGYEFDDDYHWSKCNTCDGIIDKKKHELVDVITIKNPTFIEEGIITGTCKICGYIIEKEIPKLILASTLNFNEDVVKVNINDTFEIKAIVGPTGAENYDIEWKIENNEYLYLTADKNVCTITSNDKIGIETITIRVTNTLNDVDYVYLEKSIDVYIYEEPAPVVQYDFDNGVISNTGTNQTINGRVTTLSGDSIVNSTAIVEYGKDVNGYEEGSIKLSQKKVGGNHFTISGLNIGTGDFTIKTKLFMDGIVSLSDSSTYLFGIGSETDSNGCTKDVKAPYFNISLKQSVDGNQIRFVANGDKALMPSGFILPHNKWVEVTLVRDGNNLTLSITELDTYKTNSATITLSSKDSLIITKDCNLAFAGNSGCQNGAQAVSTYYDEITIYDYNTEHIFMNYISDDNATCEYNCTETSICALCDVTHTREIPNTTIEHKYENYVSDNNGTCDSNGTETSKCNTCDRTHTQEELDSKLKHVYAILENNGDGTETVICLHCESEIVRQTNVCVHTESETVKINLNYHWTECTICGDAVNASKHDFSDWEVVNEPTFDEDGLKTRTCLCGYKEEKSIDKLIEVTDISLVSKNISVISSEVEEYDLLATLLGNISGKTPNSYVIKWLSTDEEIATLEYESNTCKLFFTGKLGKVIIQIVVDNVLDGNVISTVETECIVNVLDDPIVRYTFNNGQVSNTGTNQTINGRVTTLNTNKQVVDPTAAVTYTKDSTGVENSAIILSQKRDGGNHFTISGLTIGTGDFTIKTRLFMDGIVSNSSSSTYLFGIGSETDANGCAKDVKAPYFNAYCYLASGKNRLRLLADGVKTDSNSEGGFYLPTNMWVDVILVRSGNVVTLSYVEVESGITNSISYTLSSDESINITEACNLGFAGNSGCQNGAPGVSTYYDEIMIFDYAI